MKKRILAILLVFCMLFGNVTSVYADGLPEAGQTEVRQETESEGTEREERNDPRSRH